MNVIDIDQSINLWLHDIAEVLDEGCDVPENQSVSTNVSSFNDDWSSTNPLAPAAQHSNYSRDNDLKGKSNKN